MDDHVKPRTEVGSTPDQLQQHSSSQLNDKVSKLKMYDTINATCIENLFSIYLAAS